MRRFGLPLFLAAQVILLLTIVVTAGAPPSAPPDRAVLHQPPPAAPRQVDREIGDILQRRRVALDDLRGRLEAAGDAAVSRAIRLRIRELLAESEIEIMEAQLRHLRRQGEDAAAARLEEQIAIMRDPEQRRRALVRPVDRTEEERVR